MCQALQIGLLQTTQLPYAVRPADICMVILPGCPHPVPLQSLLAAGFDSSQVQHQQASKEQQT
jgi:hypothetical protein